MRKTPDYRIYDKDWKVLQALLVLLFAAELWSLVA